MATLYKEGVEGKYKWLTPKQAKKYGIPPEYKLMEETVLSHLAKILQKTGAKPSVVYSLFTDETGCKRITAHTKRGKRLCRSLSQRIQAPKIWSGGGNTTASKRDGTTPNLSNI